MGTVCVMYEVGTDFLFIIRLSPCVIIRIFNALVSVLVLVHSFSSLPYERSKSSSKVSPPHSAI